MLFLRLKAEDGILATHPCMRAVIVEAKRLFVVSCHLPRSWQEVSLLQQALDELTADLSDFTGNCPCDGALIDSPNA